MPFGSVLITGANRGIGFEFARQFAMEPSDDGEEWRPEHVFACCRDPESADELVELAREVDGMVEVHVVKMDVTNDEQINLAAKYVESVVGDAGLNLLINNAGILVRDGTRLPNVDRDLLMKHFDVNATSPLIVTQALLPLLRKAASHHFNEPMSVYHAGVVNITSGAGSISSATSGADLTGYGYRLSKAALNMVTKCLSLDLKKERILFAAISPGWVRTDMGGPRAMFTPSDSIASMLAAFKTFNDQHTGGYFQKDGDPLSF